MGGLFSKGLLENIYDIHFFLLFHVTPIFLLQELMRRLMTVCFMHAVLVCCVPTYRNQAPSNPCFAKCFLNSNNCNSNSAHCY